MHNDRYCTFRLGIPYLKNNTNYANKNKLAPSILNEILQYQSYEAWLQFVMQLTDTCSSSEQDTQVIKCNAFKEIISANDLHHITNTWKIKLSNFLRYCLFLIKNEKKIYLFYFLVRPAIFDGDMSCLMQFLKITILPMFSLNW